MYTVGAYEAKTHLGELLDRVERGEPVLITRHGVAVAVLQPAQPLPMGRADAIAALKAARAARATSEEIRQWIDEGRP